MDKETKDPTPVCLQCVHFLPKKPKKAVNPESKDHGGWCQVLGLTTSPMLCRCGGDDFEEKFD